MKETKVAWGRSAGAPAEASRSGGLLGGGLLVLGLVSLDAGGAGGGGLLLLEGGGDDVGGQGELLDEELDALVGDRVVSPLPAEDLLEEALGLE